MIQRWNVAHIANKTIFTGAQFSTQAYLDLRFYTCVHIAEAEAEASAVSGQSAMARTISAPSIIIIIFTPCEYTFLAHLCWRNHALPFLVGILVHFEEEKLDKILLKWSIEFELQEMQRIVLLNENDDLTCFQNRSIQVWEHSSMNMDTQY